MTIVVKISASFNPFDVVPMKTPPFRVNLCLVAVHEEIVNNYLS